jgi:hypothetical protein
MEAYEIWDFYDGENSYFGGLVGGCQHIWRIILPPYSFGHLMACQIHKSDSGNQHS